MKESKLYKGLMATIIIVALGAPVIASADAGSELKGTAVKVSYADLNLEKQQGAKALYQRLQQASRRACGFRSLDGKASVRTLRDAQQCYREALSEAVAEIGNELLTEVHNS